MLHTILLVLHIVVAIALIAFILLQQGRGATAGAAFGSGASSTVFGARGSASFLSRTTAILAVVFFSICLALALMASRPERPASIVDRLAAPEAAEQQSERQDIPPAPVTEEPRGAADLPSIPDDAP